MKEETTNTSNVVENKKAYKLLGNVDSYDWNDTNDKTNAIKAMQNEVPILIKNLPMGPTKNWTWDYLSKHLPKTKDTKFSVYLSHQKKFLYSDEDKNYANYKFEKNTEKVDWTWEQLEKYREEAKNDENKWWYLQQLLKQEVGDQIVQDFQGVDWTLINTLRVILRMGTIKINSLWVGKAGVLSPLHFDEPNNIFYQIEGQKKFTLFSPKNWVNLYPFPNAHSCDRQSQVDIENPDLQKFPKLVNAEAWEAYVGPGDTLYLPPYWWHQVESLTQSVSLTYWFNPSPPEYSYPLSESQVVAVRRNIEKMMGMTIGPGNVPRFLTEILEGRFDNVELTDPSTTRVYGNSNILQMLEKENK
eukprot:TRINITY_DN5508_c0_g1_i1.p1 TRINITY_DN5508_c0_g1~~TRINITY_DN5508_c0_g1_i1.p1  ORF type:complete len:358 (-),score=98.19 TRINITY_DN5508_c0_g1_i1:28-1101(-)